MPPPMQRFGGAPNNLASHYQQYPHSQAHSAGLPPPSLGNNPGFMNANSMNNPFAVNGNALSISGGFGGSGLGMPGGTGLASQAAQMGFANASMQQHGHNGVGEAGSRNRAKGESRIREVWKNNLAEEMAILRQLVDQYQYIAMVRWDLTGRAAKLADSPQGYRVSWYCRKAYGGISGEKRLPLPVLTV